MLKLNFKPYLLQLSQKFTISTGSRTNAPLVLTCISFEGYEGYGEASVPSLYGESFESVSAFLSKIDLSQFADPFESELILTYVDGISPGNQAAKTAVDIALHDLIGKLLNLPLHKYFGLPKKDLATSMTISIDTPQVMAERALKARDFKYLKIKLGTQNDKVIIDTIRSVSNQPLFIDANQGWKIKEEALDFIYWLKERDVVFVEQPLLKTSKDDQAWLKERSPLPIIGDEGFQRLSDLKEATFLYHGINIKLMKSTGLREAWKMAIAAKAYGMKVMLGCMSETSCAISAASQLGALADWVDLDGNINTLNNPFTGTTLVNGRLKLSDLPGIGLQEVHWDKIQANVEVY